MQEKVDNPNLGYVEFQLPMHIQVVFSRELETQVGNLGERYGFINPYGNNSRNLKN